MSEIINKNAKLQNALRLILCCDQFVLLAYHCEFDIKEYTIPDNLFFVSNVRD